MPGHHAFQFLDSGKAYTLVSSVEDPGTQPRFALALTDGSFSWTADSAPRVHVFHAGMLAALCS